MARPTRQNERDARTLLFGACAAALSCGRAAAAAVVIPAYALASVSLTRRMNSPQVTRAALLPPPLLLIRQCGLPSLFAVLSRHPARTHSHAVPKT